MATKLPNHCEEFDLGDLVTFPDPEGGGDLRGKIVRVYNAGDLFHVLADGVRYQVDISEMRIADQD